MQALEFITKGVKCDNPKCDYLDENFDIPKDVEGRRAYVGTPCPKCGESLLTMADFRLFQFVLKVTGWTNKLFGNVPDGPRQHFKLEMDGTGIPKSITKLEKDAI